MPQRHLDTESLIANCTTSVATLNLHSPGIVATSIIKPLSKAPTFDDIINWKALISWPPQPCCCTFERLWLRRSLYFIVSRQQPTTHASRLLTVQTTKHKIRFSMLIKILLARFRLGPLNGWMVEWLNNCLPCCVC